MISYQFLPNILFICYLILILENTLSNEIEENKDNVSEETILLEHNAESPCLLKVLTFSRVNLTRQDLVNNLKNCSEIEELNLYNIDWKWDGKSLEKAYTPNLKSFVADIHGRIFKSEMDLESVIPFYKDKNNIGGLLELKNMSYDIYLHDTVTNEILEMRPGELKIIKFIDCNIFQWLRNILTQFEKIYIANSIIYSKDVNFTYATNIYFENITIKGSHSKILKTAKNLNQIQFVGEVEVTDVGNVSPIQILYDGITNCSLTILVIDQVKVIRNDIIKVLNRCNGITELILENIIWEWDTESTTKSYLPSLNKFRIQLNTELPSYLFTLQDFQSLILFYKNNSTEQQIALKGLEYLIHVYFGNAGYLYISDDTLNINSTTILDVTDVVYGLATQFKTIQITSCTITAEKLILTNATKIQLWDNNIIGSVSVILNSTKLATNIKIKLKKDEAVDVAALPSKSLYDLQSSKLSFRWSSIGPVNFSRLAWLNLEKCDVDLALFKTEQTMRIDLVDFSLWSSDLQVNDINIHTLTVECRYKRYCQKLNLCNIPAGTIERMTLVNIEVTTKKCTTSFTELYDISLTNVKFDNDITEIFSKFFPNLETVVIRIGSPKYNFIIPSILNRVSRFTIEIINDMSDAEIATLQYNLKLWMNIDVENIRGRGTTIAFEKIENLWTNTSYQFTIFESEQRRFDDILKKFELDGSEIDENTLNTLIQVYPIIVYVICSLGIMFNIISAVVLFQKSMRSSTNYIMISLTFCDTLFLVACFLTTFEFKLLFVPGYNKNWFISNFVYPLQKIGYTGSIYMTILITIERYIATCYPLLCHSIFTAKKSLKYIMTALLLVNILNVTRWLENIELNYEASSPIWSNWNPKQLHKLQIYEYLYLKFIWYASTYVIPSILIIVFNTLIVKEAKKAYRDRQRFLGRSRQQKDEHSLTRLLLTVVVVFLICNSISGTINWIFISRNVEPEVAETFAILPVIINSSVNFLLYYFMGTKFRNEFKATWLRCFKCLRKKQNQTQTTEISTIPMSSL